MSEGEVQRSSLWGARGGRLVLLNGRPKEVLLYSQKESNTWEASVVRNLRAMNPYWNRQ